MINKTFNLFSEPPNVVGGILLKVKAIEDETLFKLYKKKVALVESESAKGGVLLSKYVSGIISDLVINTKDISDLLDEVRQTEIESQILWTLYHDLIEVYPCLSLKSVLVDSVFEVPDFGDEEFQEMLDSFLPSKKQIKPTPEKNPGKATAKKDKGFVTKEDVDKLERYLKRNLIGQNTAIDQTIKSLKVVASGLSSRASLFFLGTTGIGKTQLANLIGEKYGEGLIKINCGEYSKSHEYSKLIGSPPGYVGHSETSFLGERAKKSSKWVFLFDEIEKADEKLFDVLLNILDEGTIDDNSGKTLNFKDSIFLFTSNNGLHDRLKKRVGLGSSNYVTYDEVKDEIKDDLKKTFKPEFLNRLDQIILFDSLTKEDVAKIVKLQLKAYPIKVSKEILDIITEKSYSSEYGARNVKRYIKNHIAPVIAESILGKELPINNQAHYNVEYINGEFAVVDTEQKEDLIEKEILKKIAKKPSVKRKAPIKST
jgi:hypothetical protein